MWTCGTIDDLCNIEYVGNVENTAKINEKRRRMDNIDREPKRKATFAKIG